MYVVQNTMTEQTSEHRTWDAAFKAASKHPAGQVVIIERDRDGERTYNTEGKILEIDSHFR